MRKGIFLLVILYATVLFSGCSAATPDNVDRIGRPVNREVILEGTWELEKCLSGESTSKTADKTTDRLVGEKIGFSQDAMVFAGQYQQNIRYKVKKVDAHEYFLHKNQEVLKSLAFKSSEVLVITVYSQDKFLYEFIKDSEGSIVANMDEQYYCMKKISDKMTGIEGAAAGTLAQDDADTDAKNKRLLQSGLLLGIRSPVKTDDSLGDYTYSTYWISSVDRTLRPVLIAKDIYLPRMNGFWRLQVEKRLGTEGIEDYLLASMVSKNGSRLLPKAAAENTSRRVETKVRNTVLYVGNDYVCVENVVFEGRTGQSGNGYKKVLRTLPVDNLNNADGIKISDLAGENGTMAMESAISDLLKDSGINGITSIDADTQEENFALFRKTGHWFLKGRLNLDTEGQLPYIDFNLNLIPPANMVAYDMLHVTWTEIKDKLPQAVDIYTSPNRDLAVVLTQNEILLYSINAKTISEEPMAKLPIIEGSAVFMAEWAMADYVQSWEKSFMNNNETQMVKIER